MPFCAAANTTARTVLNKLEGMHMSFNLGVWYPHERLTNTQAGELYVGLCEGTADGPPPHPAVEAFYEELTTQHPELDDVPANRLGDHEYSPWSCEIDHLPGHVIMASVWPKADYVDNLVKELARKHGLAVFDPQSERITYPDGSLGVDDEKPWWKFW